MIKSDRGKKNLEKRIETNGVIFEPRKIWKKKNLETEVLVISKCEVGRGGGREGEQTYGRDDQWR